MDDRRPAALIAIDWGTTAVRAYRVAADGGVIAARGSDQGIGRVADGNFGAALDALLGEWRTDDVPRVACGMIGSRQGWVEAPYVACPAGLEAFGNALTRTPRGEILIVPGAMCRDAGGVPDVMRGEETQLVGAIAPDESRVLAVLPGTHSKWALVERGSLTAFATFMTGELFAVLVDHSILGRMAADGPRGTTGSDGDDGDASAANAAFLAGADLGLGGDALAHDLFGARTLALTGALGAARVRDWLSGLLIGYEVAAARRWARAHDADALPTRVIGSPALTARYAIALDRAGSAIERGREDAAAVGLWRIALRAGLVH